MKSFKLILFILVIFLKTGNVLSENKLFNVNNIEIITKSFENNENLAYRAMKKGYEELINRILLEKDVKKLSELDFNEVQNLVSYYQILDDQIKKEKNKKYFNIYFDKEKFHNLLYLKGISYSDIENFDIYLLPLLKKNDKVFVYSNNYFYQNWKKKNESELIEFILPIENIETIQQINLFQNKLFDIDPKDIFEDYENKNLTLIIIEIINEKEIKVFLKTSIMGKRINRSLKINDKDLTDEKLYDYIILKVKNEIINIVKSQNLIDIRVPSFINIKFIQDKNNSLLELKKRINNIGLIEEIYVQELNNEFISIKIKYLGKIDKIIEKLKNEKVILKYNGEEWSLKII